MGTYKRESDTKPKCGLRAAVRRWQRIIPADRLAELSDKLRSEALGEKEKPLIRAFREAIRTDARTINAIAVEAGLSAAAVWRFVEGERSLSLDSTAALAEVLSLKLTHSRNKRTRRG